MENNNSALTVYCIPVLSKMVNQCCGTEFKNPDPANPIPELDPTNNIDFFNFPKKLSVTNKGPF